MSLIHKVFPKFKVVVDQARCKKCTRCVNACSFGVLSFNGERIVADNDKCVDCQR